MNRLSIMGELAASLAHEVLHPIATARNNARAGTRFLETSPPNLDEARAALGCVVSDVDRARDIVGRMRDHIKKTPPRREPFDLNEAASEVIVMVRSAIAKNGIAVSTQLTDGLASVQGDRVQLQQVVMNLILNAVEAMSWVETGATAADHPSRSRLDRLTHEYELKHELDGSWAGAATGPRARRHSEHGRSSGSPPASSSSKALEFLRHRLTATARALRNGVWRSTAPAGLVPGDVVHLRMGTRTNRICHLR